MGRVTAAFFVVLKPDRQYWGDKKINGIRATDLRQNKPKVPAGAVAVKVKLTFDTEALEANLPIVEQDVPNEAFITGTPVLEVG